MLILASKSPRRTAILQELGLDFQVIPSAYDEKHDISNDPHELALLHATGKAEDVLSGVADRKNDVILGVDTLVYVNGEILGKPSDAGDAKSMIKKLSSRPHQVVTALCLIRIKDKKTLTHVETTEVDFKNLGEDDIDTYIASNEWQDKAGAYAIQGAAARFIERVSGDISNVIGLPKNSFGELYDKLICEV